MAALTCGPATGLLTRRPPPTAPIGAEELTAGSPLPCSATRNGTASGRPWAGPPGPTTRKFATLDLRLANQDELDRHVETWTSGRDPFEAMQLLQQSGVRAGVCQTAEDRVEHDPQLAHLQWLVECPQTEIGTWPVREVPIRYGRTPATQGGTLGRGAPNYGEDNQYVLKQILGLSDDEINDLSEGVI